MQMLGFNTQNFALPSGTIVWANESNNMGKVFVYINNSGTFVLFA